MKVLDVSRQSTGFVISVEQFRRAKADGYQAVVVGLYDGAVLNPYAAGVCANALEAGLDIAGYIAIAPATDAAHAVSLSHDLLGNGLWEKLSFVSIDIELEGVTFAQCDAALRAVIVYRQRPVVYTAKWFWTAHFGNTTAFAAYPLWAAFYDGDPDYDFPSQPFGGWTASVMEQYQGTTSFTYGGQEFGADLNVVSDAFWNNGPSSSAGLLALVAAWKTDMEDTIRGAADLHEGLPSSTRLALFGLAQEQKARRWALILGGQ